MYAPKCAPLPVCGGGALEASLNENRIELSHGLNHANFLEPDSDNSTGNGAGEWGDRREAWNGGWGWGGLGKAMRGRGWSGRTPWRRTPGLRKLLQTWTWMEFQGNPEGKALRKDKTPHHWEGEAGGVRQARMELGGVGAVAGMGQVPVRGPGRKRWLGLLCGRNQDGRSDCVCREGARAPWHGYPRPQIRGPDRREALSSGCASPTWCFGNGGEMSMLW